MSMYNNYPISADTEIHITNITDIWKGTDI